MHVYLPLISTLFIAVSAILIAFGWYHIIKGRRETHKKLMLTGSFFALAFFIMYVTRIALIGSSPFGGPDSLKTIYLIFLLFHIVLATTAGVFGIVTLVLAFTERFAKHRRVGRITAVMWFITAVTGITVYSMVYVIYPSGHTKPLFDAIFG